MKNKVYLCTWCLICIASTIAVGQQVFRQLQPTARVSRHITPMHGASNTANKVSEFDTGSGGGTEYRLCTAGQGMAKRWRWGQNPDVLVTASGGFERAGPHIVHGACAGSAAAWAVLPPEPKRDRDTGR